MPKPEGLELGELCERTGVTARTVRYYIQQGLLRSPGPGPQARYDNGHLHRLLLIRRLQKEHLPLAEIRQRLEGLDDETVLHLSRRPDAAPPTAADYVRSVLARAAPAARPPPSPALPASPARSQWERIVLAPDVELHVRRPLAREDNRTVERLIDEAQRLFTRPIR